MTIPTEAQNAEAIPDLTVADVARELQIHPDTVRDLLNSRALIGYKPGRRAWRIQRADLDAYKTSQKANTSK